MNDYRPKHMADPGLLRMSWEEWAEATTSHRSDRGLVHPGTREKCDSKHCPPEDPHCEQALKDEAMQRVSESFDVPMEVLSPKTEYQRYIEILNGIDEVKYGQRQLLILGALIWLTVLVFFALWVTR